MKFSQFILVSEVFDDLKSDFEFVQSGDKYIYHFKMGEFDYKIFFTIMDDYNPFNFEIGKIYEVEFSGPAGTSLTNFNKNTHVIYSQLLSAVKSFVTQFKPNGLYFYGSESTMDLVYNRFIKRFFQDTPGKNPQEVFYQVNQSLFISKARYNKMSDEQKEYVQKSMAEADQANQVTLSRVASRKTKLRQKFVYAKNNIGSILTIGQTGEMPIGGLIIAVRQDQTMTVLGLKQYDNLKMITPEWIDVARNYQIYPPEAATQANRIILRNALMVLFDPEVDRKVYQQQLNAIPAPIIQTYRKMYDQILGGPVQFRLNPNLNSTQ